jgi:exopolysaccharide production protein ExoY
MSILGGNSTRWRAPEAPKLDSSARMSERTWPRLAVQNSPMRIDAAGADSPAATSLSGIRRSQPGPIGGAAKRCLDIVIALSAIVLTLPLMTAIALLLCFNGGSPIFAHERVGFGGRRFRCHKFRTMVPDADARLAELFARRPDLEEHWKTRRKLPGDPRTTRLGRFLRQSSLDELPQLFDVLGGAMSCVGPRPVTEEELEHYGPFVREYQSVRPGLTGLWQVSGRNEVSFSDRVALDVDYVKNWSLRSDIAILARTPFALFNFKTVY